MLRICVSEHLHLQAAETSIAVQDVKSTVRLLVGSTAIHLALHGLNRRLFLCLSEQLMTALVHSQSRGSDLTAHYSVLIISTFNSLFGQKTVLVGAPRHYAGVVHARLL